MIGKKRRKKKKTRKNKRLGEPFGVRLRRFLSRAVKTVVVASGVAAAGLSAWWVWGWATTTELLAVDAVEVAGAARVPAEEVSRLAGVLRGQNIITLKFESVVRAIENMAWVKDAEISRRPPGRVVIEVAERVPFLLVMLDGLYVMDTEGVIFKRHAATDALDLPIVTGMEGGEKEGEARLAPELEGALFKLVGVLRENRVLGLGRVSEIHLDPVYGLSVHTLDEGVRVEMGFSRFAEKLDALGRVIEARRGSLKGVEFIDLNNSREVVVSFATEAVKEGGVI